MALPHRFISSWAIQLLSRSRCPGATICSLWRRWHRPQRPTSRQAERRSERPHHCHRSSIKQSMLEWAQKSKNIYKDRPLLSPIITFSAVLELNTMPHLHNRFLSAIQKKIAIKKTCSQNRSAKISDFRAKSIKTHPMRSSTVSANQLKPSFEPQITPQN